MGGVDEMYPILVNSNRNSCLITELRLNGTVCSLEIRIGPLPRRPIMFRDVSYIHVEVYLCDLITLRQLTGNPINEHGMKFTYTCIIH